MSNLTLPTEKQCFGKNRLNVIKHKDGVAESTDFASLLGISKSPFHKLNGCYWTKSGRNGDSVIIADDSGRLSYCHTCRRYIGIRPIIPLEDSERIPTNVGGTKSRKNGILEVEYGYYPQEAAPKEIQDELELRYEQGELSKTGNSYTTDSRPDDPGLWFAPWILTEYEHNGRRYVRVIANLKQFKEELSNSIVYYQNDPVWVEVQPVKWLVDERERVMIAEKIICSGVQFRDIRESSFAYAEAEFGETNIARFMEQYMAKEMFQERVIQIGKDSERSIPNTYGLDFEEVSEEDIIRGAIESNVAVFLHGKPGCGKSDRVRQLDPDFIELNLSHLDPELLDGLAGEKDGKAVHIKPPWLEELEAKCEEEPEKIHILFLEELTNASGVMQSKAYGIALDKKVAGRWKLPANARVVAAGNELDDSLVANEMAEPLYDRFAHVNIETTVDSWLEWAVTPESSYERLDYKEEKESRPKIHPAVYAYISYKGEEVLRTEYNREHPEPHADPRRWKMASDMLYATNNPQTLRAIVGEDITRDFIYFCQQPTITIEDVLEGNYSESAIEQMDMGRRLATVAGMTRVDSEHMKEVREFVKKLGPEMCKKFEAQWTHGDEERLEQLQEIILEEKEETERNEHEGEEARTFATAGVLGYSKIEENYRAYERREARDDKGRNK